MKFVRRYIEKPHLVLSFVILLSVVGIMGYQKMPFNLFPDTDRPQISVVTVMPGAAAARCGDGHHQGHREGNLEY